MPFYNLYLYRIREFMFLKHFSYFEPHTFSRTFTRHRHSLIQIGPGRKYLLTWASIYKVMPFVQVAFLLLHFVQLFEVVLDFSEIGFHVEVEQLLIFVLELSPHQFRPIRCNMVTFPLILVFHLDLMFKVAVVFNRRRVHLYRSRMCIISIVPGLHALLPRQLWFL